MTAALPFHLSAVLAGHSQDVRALVAINDSLLASASRDTKVIIWQRLSEGKPEFVQKSIFSGHSHFVNSLACAPPSSAYPAGLVYSGGSDKLIYAFDPNDTHVPVLTLAGHRDNVCALNVAQNGDLISGSWDKTAKVWRDGSILFNLEGHTQAVWGVLAIEPDKFLTASADKTIKLWHNSKCVHTFSGHDDVVRGIAPVPGVGFASSSNDGTIRVWRLSGETVLELHGHTSFVYSLASIGPGELASSGEDRTVRVWNETGLIQTLTQPCISVWSVAAFPNSDIAAAGSDGYIRIFSRSPERKAAQDLIETFEGQIASSAIPSNQVGDINKDKLPGLDALNILGTKDGQVKMIRVGNAVEAYQWSTSKAEWTKIGEVVDAVGNTRKQIYNGKEYDFVFDVDIQEGAPPLKLPFNATEDPYQAAQNFIHRNDLPQSYLDQIADFIIKNTAGFTLGAASSQYADPFTGGSRYVPSAGQPSLQPVAQQQQTQAASPAKLLPMRDFTTFKAINLKAVHTKILQFNSDLEKSMEYGEVAIKSDDEKALGKLIESLEKGHFNALKPEDYKLASYIAFEWPEQNRFPGLDLLRILLLHSALPAQADGDFVGSLFRAAGLPVTDSSTINKSQEINAMLVVRALSNMTAQPVSRGALLQRRQDELSKLSGNKNLRVALATLYLNLAVLLLQPQNADDALAVDLVELLTEMLKSETDGEALIRELVALGTLLGASASAREAAELLDLRGAIVNTRKNTGDTEAKLRMAETEVLKLLPTKQ